MAFGFPAHHEESSSPGVSAADARLAARDTLRALGWTIQEAREDEVRASTGVNLLSWGERMRIRFRTDGSLSVVSECSFPTQCFDWGKNKANVDRFMAEFGRRVREAGATGP